MGSPGHGVVSESHGGGLSDLYDTVHRGFAAHTSSLPELITNTTPEAWARESWQIAVDQVYLRGHLKYGLDSVSAMTLPEGYTKNLKSIAAVRVTLGGYRLADLIREVVR